MRRGRSFVATWKALRTLRIPAGDPAEGDGSCDCGAIYLLTEDSRPIELEQDSQWLSPE